MFNTHSVMSITRYKHFSHFCIISKKNKKNLSLKYNCLPAKLGNSPTWRQIKNNNMTYCQHTIIEHTPQILRLRGRNFTTTQNTYFSLEFTVSVLSYSLRLVVVRVHEILSREINGWWTLHDGWVRHLSGNEGNLQHAWLVYSACSD